MRLIAERHALTFFFLWRSDLEPPARAVYAQRPRGHIGMRPSSITASDRRALACV
jgi:hypothetical protein